MLNDGTKDIKTHLAEHQICRSVGGVLEAHYPGWRWWVECKAEAGVVYVKNLDLSGEYGFVIHLARLAQDPDLKLVMRGGGEVLERYHQHRGQRPERLSVERDITGEAIGETDAA
jgi:hypothetical protein